MILLVEPFYTGSHKSWAEGFQAHSNHDVEILSLPGRHWKWRMHGAAVTLAQQFLEKDLNPDLIVVSDMLDLTTFQALTRSKTADIPFAVYFHENQLTYPWSPKDEDVNLQRDHHYCFINYTSALGADKVFFNSSYHLESFFEALPGFLSAFPDHQGTENVDVIRAKSEVLPLGLDLHRFDEFEQAKQEDGPLRILWNHRWEYDKNPDQFFEVLRFLRNEGFDFRLDVVGESYNKIPPAFESAKEDLKDHIDHWGYAESFDDYARLLWNADVLPVTSRQDFFGISAVEAMYCNTFPILPNRLAFPSHIPQNAEQRHRYYYDDFQSLLDRLRWALKNPEIVRGIDASKYIKRYDWSEMKLVYDEALKR